MRRCDMNALIKVWYLVFPVDKGPIHENTLVGEAMTNQKGIKEQELFNSFIKI